MKARAHIWFDTDRFVPVYGVQVRHDGKWKNFARNGEPLLFDSAAERDSELAKIRGELSADEMKDIQDLVTEAVCRVLDEHEESRERCIENNLSEEGAHWLRAWLLENTRVENGR